MKKPLILVFIFALFLVSCATTGNQNGGDILAKMGQDGDIVVSIKGDDKISSVYLELNENDINGVIIGNFSKLQGKIAYNYLDLEDFNIYQPKKGTLVFSTNKAKDYYLNLIKKNEYVDSFDCALMLSSDVAVYSIKPNEKIDKLFFISNNNLFDLSIDAVGIKEAESLMKLLKADYLSYLTKKGLKYNIKDLGGHFIINDDNVYLIDLDILGAFDLWKTLKKDCFQQFSLVEF